MGKALIFSGVQVQEPLQTVTFIKTLVTASDYVDEYAKLATSVTSEQKQYLTTFIETLMSKGIWDKVRSFYPMLGGLSGYNKDAKDVFNQKEWNAPVNGTSWDDTRNAPYFNLPGKAVGKELVFDDLDYRNCAFFISIKALTAINSRNILSNTYNGSKKGFISNLRCGAYSYPEWGTPSGSANFPNFKTTKNCNISHLVNMSDGKNYLYCCSNDADIKYVTEGNTNDYLKSEDEVSFAFGGSYLLESSAPATNTFNGCINMFIAFNSKLTEEEIKAVTQTIWDFDEACGRHTNFE